ncbi:MAG: hypothetical protein HY326_08065 [Chloroflexi bacterium]|nr:hypothetical protein [Chloroflexota bacterium]
MTTATLRSEITLQRPHSDGQAEVIEYPGNVVLFCGRRWGKTTAGASRILLSAIQRPGLYWWVGLSWRSASLKRAWRVLKHYTRAMWRAAGLDPGPHIRESDKELYLPGGSVIWLRTAERPDSLAGEGVRGVVLDEFSLMSPSVWEEFIEATLLDYGGWAFFAGVPKGKNWAARLFTQAGEREGWIARRYTTYDNPHLNKARIDEVRDHTPEAIFMQEYLAAVLDDAGAVFRRVIEAATALEQEQALPGHEYVLGVDWGRTTDFTVFAVIDLTLNELVYLDRFNQIGYELQAGRLQSLRKRFNPTAIIAEANSMGRPIIERLQAEGLPVQAFTTTNASKAQIVEGLALAFERGEFHIIPDPVLIGELQAFAQERLPSGLIRYGAPEGMHDDTVMALAIGYYGANQATPGQIEFWYDGDGPDSEPSNVLELVGKTHDDSRMHRKWAMRHVCLQCRQAAKERGII